MTKSFFYKGISFLLLAVLISCSLFEKEDQGLLVARVNEHTLTKEEIASALNNNYGIDSASTVQAYINQWATDKLLIDGALRNLTEEEQAAYESLVEGYRTDLYTKHYKDALIQQQIDSTISYNEVEEFYEDNQKNFLLNEELIQFRFVHVDEKFSDLETVKEAFIRDNSEDRYTLDSLKFQFKNHLLNDSIWVKKSALIQKVNVINNDNVDRLLKKTNFVQLRDSLGLYLIAIKNTLGRGDIAPLQYVRPTINQIIRNRRKVELVKQLEKEIKDDAIKNKKFEIYN